MGISEKSRLGGGAFFSKMRMARLVVYSPALGATDRQLVETYLKSRYGLPSDYTRKVIYSGGVRHQAFPGLALLSNGDLLAIWNDGSTLESSSDRQVDSSRSTNGGKVWNTPSLNVYTGCSCIPNTVSYAAAAKGNG